MQHENSGPVPPQPIRRVPHTYARRQGTKPDRRMVLIDEAVQLHGAAYDPKALAEETGLPIDSIRRFAAQIMVGRGLVGLGVVHRNDAIRMGSEALAASLRIEAASRDCPARILHCAVGFFRTTKVLQTADVMGLRRLARRNEDRRAVVAPRTICPRCGARSDVNGGCRHQHALVPTDTIEKGRAPHA